MAAPRVEACCGRAFEGSTVPGPWSQGELDSRVPSFPSRSPGLNLGRPRAGLVSGFADVALGSVDVLTELNVGGRRQQAFEQGLCQDFFG